MTLDLGASPFAGQDIPVTRARKPRGQGATRRGEILAAAKSLFLEEGFERTTMRRIAAVVGISSTALYQLVAGFSRRANLSASRHSPGFLAGATESGQIQFSGRPEWLEVSVDKRFHRNWVLGSLNNLSCRICGITRLDGFVEGWDLAIHSADVRLP